MSEVTFSPVTWKDMDEYLAGVQRSEELHRDLVWAPSTEGEFKLWFDSLGENKFGGVLTVPSQGVVGFININDILRHPYHKGVLGFGMFFPHNRKGFMTQGLALAIQYAWQNLGLHRLEADVQPTNVPSQRVLIMNGFELEALSKKYVQMDGIWLDHYRFSLLNE